ncbi:hypothetical protein TELCIR_22446 [Teladorsagia circumcincta]|uniref:Uncharacterized protein n=1 Tax=Teladorsagia circumcincta TaxID=45464 RepID=A0A2G9TDW2_TELCI|nr:hypothetical protein TELCIR_22446 [Teladorsagia circumcincta]
MRTFQSSCKMQSFRASWSKQYRRNRRLLPSKCSTGRSSMNFGKRRNYCGSISRTLPSQFLRQLSATFSNQLNTAYRQPVSLFVLLLALNRSSLFSAPCEFFIMNYCSKNLGSCCVLATSEESVCILLFGLLLFC